ncbi:MAG: hypothetical protein HQL97_01080 [Magnetococcales bacterium]|nr:hypothetical protein [Magnetococcales bacterium]
MEADDEQKKILAAAKRGYDGYCDYTDWKSLVTGDRLPAWEGLKPSIKNAWYAAAEAILIKS